LEAHALRHGHQRHVAIGDHLPGFALDVADALRVTKHAHQLRLAVHMADRVDPDKLVVQRRREGVQVIGGDGSHTLVKLWTGAAAVPAPNTSLPIATRRAPMDCRQARCFMSGSHKDSALPPSSTKPGEKKSSERPVPAR
jgi:hypothetical protein